MKTTIRTEQRDFHDFLGKHVWIEMDTKHLARVSGIFQSPMCEGAINSLGLKNVRLHLWRG